MPTPTTVPCLVRLVIYVGDSLCLADGGCLQVYTILYCIHTCTNYHPPHARVGGYGLVRCRMVPWNRYWFFSLERLPFKGFSLKGFRKPGRLSTVSPRGALVDVTRHCRRPLRWGGAQAWVTSLVRYLERGWFSLYGPFTASSIPPPLPPTPPRWKTCWRAAPK